MVNCPECEAKVDIEGITPGKNVKCAECGTKSEVVKEGKKIDLYPTDIEY